ncbi:MAG TPA: tRNA lysidine(34) synthetase TilS, partial [Phycisphaerae bacterium]|nr:tRNA lysidine(34) synthetase TilS [Phycisphaerae bacterium]
MAQDLDNLNDLPEQTGAFIDRCIHVPRGASIVVGVSGGLDSVALMSVLGELACMGERQYRLEVAHLDHGLRSGSADDADFVAALAKKFHLPCHIEKVDVAGQALPSEGIEQAGRRLRYDFLRRTAILAGSQIVAVAHHADDNVETVLFNLFRGTHLRGLGGMKPIRAMGKSGISLIRPFLQARRDEIETYCRMRHLSWREDESNTDKRFTRNFIRCELLPLLRDRLNPDLSGAVSRIARSAAEIDEFVSQIAEELFSSCQVDAAEGFCCLDVAALQQARPVIRRYVFRLALESIEAPMRAISAGHYEALSSMVDSAGNQSIDLPGLLRAKLDRGLVLLGPASCGGVEEEQVELLTPGTKALPG